MKIASLILKILITVLNGILVIASTNMITSIIWLIATILWSVNVGMEIMHPITEGEE